MGVALPAVFGFASDPKDAFGKLGRSRVDVLAAALHFEGEPDELVREDTRGKRLSQLGARSTDRARSQEEFRERFEVRLLSV